ncbi:MAG: hypothetical protein ACLQVI_08195, partial [Polyangiaceae bacterium]
MNITTRNWRDLIRPRGIQVEQETLTDFYGKFTCEPLERGYGITIGNSLRRVLLSSLQGAAITAIRVEGALHEFTTVGDVVEDVTDIILNLKTAHTLPICSRKSSAILCLRASHTTSMAARRQMR